MPELSNEVPAKSGKKRGRGACAPANRRPFRTLDGTKQAKASAGEFLVLFAAKKYKEFHQPQTAEKYNLKEPISETSS
ncbi:hypothetical protein I180019D1_27180 [Alistipes sp. i18-0019-D1]